jgi:hypothetical protein
LWREIRSGRMVTFATRRTHQSWIDSFFHTLPFSVFESFNAINFNGHYNSSGILDKSGTLFFTMQAYYLPMSLSPVESEWELVFDSIIVQCDRPLCTLFVTRLNRI